MEGIPSTDVCVRCRWQGMVWHKPIVCVLGTREAVCAVHLRVALRQRLKAY
jgi:hypothetical protein